jgi:hypothetical protein
MEVCPITEFIESRPQKHQNKILRFLDLLEEMGPTLTRPFADLLDDGIHELRITLSGDHARLLYFYVHQRFIILYQAFWKHTDKVPARFIKQTIAYRDRLLKQVSAYELERMVNAGI